MGISMLQNSVAKKFKLALDLAALLLSALLLNACQEPYYRGVPQAQWDHLSAEQKSLIIDQSFNQEIGDAGKSPATGSLSAQTPIGSFGSGINSGDSVIQKLSSTQEMSTHNPNQATLVWQIGSLNAGLNNKPLPFAQSSAAHTYGKAQQVVFMTSLEESLRDKQAFKDISLVSEPPQNITEPTITIYFKSARIADDTEGNRITLDTVLKIEAPHKPAFTRTYLVTSHTDRSFRGQEAEVSNVLLDKILQGIDQWSAQTQ